MIENGSQLGKLPGCDPFFVATIINDIVVNLHVRGRSNLRDPPELNINR